MAPDFVLQRVLATEERSRNYVRGSMCTLKGKRQSRAHPAQCIHASLENRSNKLSLLQNSLGSGIYCREELLSLGARASRPHKTWQGRGDWLHRVGRFTRRLTLEQRLDKYAGGTPALPGGNPWLARCRSLSRALFCRSILPPSHARLRILQKAQLLKINHLS